MFAAATAATSSPRRSHSDRSGRRYCWIDPDAPVALLPDGWFEALRREPRIDRSEDAAREDRSSSTAYGEAALRRELERLLRAREGVRNQTLNLVVFRLAQLAALSARGRAPTSKPRRTRPRS